MDPSARTGDCRGHGGKSTTDAASGEGRLLAEGEARLSVTADENGCRYETRAPDGEAVDSGEDWAPLVARLKTALPDDADAPVSIIWP